MNQRRKTGRFAARVAAFPLALLCLFCTALPAFATVEETNYPLPTPLSNNAILYNLQFDKVLYEQNSDALIYPASFAKIMTAVLCYEYRADTGSNPQITVTAEDDLSVNGLGLVVDETLDFDTLLSAMVIGSSNDAAMVLARAVGGSVQEFVQMMNDKAASLGCENTVFCNPTGLHNGAAQTSLSDMVKICAHAYKINDYIQTSSALRFEVPATNKYDKVRVVTNSNLLLNSRSDLGYYVKDTMGINHGYTPQSGYCLATVRETDGAINLALVSGGYKDENKKNSALLDAKELLTYAEKAYEIATVLEKDNVIREVPVRLSDAQDHVLLVAGSSVSTLLPVGFNSVTDISQRVFLTEEELTAPIVEGTSYGSVDLYYKDQLIGSTELVAQRSLAKSEPLALLDAVENFLRLPVVRTILIITAAVIVFFLLLCIVLLFIQQRKKSGLTPKERRERRKLEKELLWKEKLRQQEYFRAQSAARNRRMAEITSELRAAREEHLKRQAAERKREQERARRAAANRAGAPSLSAGRPVPRPAEGCERRPAQAKPRTAPPKQVPAKRPTPSTAQKNNPPRKPRT